MGGVHRLPEDLEQMTPGPELAVLLAAVDRRALSETDQVRLIRARNRLASHVQGELFADLHAMSRREQPNEEAMLRHGEPSRYPWAQAEIAFALTWTHVAAGARLEQARQLVEDFPQVLAALCTGELDMSKVLVICELASWLADPAAARHVVDQVLARAGQQTTGQLRATLRKLVLAVDPEAARKRCAHAVATRRVQVFDNHDGTGEVWGRSLPPQDAAAAWERLTAIAKAARNAGDPRTMGQLRADALLDLLVGEGVAIGQPVGHHTAGLPEVEVDRAAMHAGASTVAHPFTAGGPTASGPAPAASGGGDDWDPQWPQRSPDEQLSADEVWPHPTGEPKDRYDDAGRAYDGDDLWPPDWPGRWIDDPAVYAAGGGSVAPAVTGGAVAPTVTGGAVAPTVTSGSVPAVTGPLPGPRRGVVELQVPLTALMSLTQLPGELTGFGPVVADIARQVADAYRDGTWRFSVYSEVGGLIQHGITRARPTTSCASTGALSGRSSGDRPVPGTGSAGSDPRRRPPGRRPPAEVAAFVRARNRTCTAPGCRRPVRDSDLDHVVDWAAGGNSEADNLSPKCRLHHRFKHESGAQVIALGDGVIGWRTPRGMQYVTAPDPPLLDDSLFSLLVGAVAGPMDNT